MGRTSLYAAAAVTAGVLFAALLTAPLGRDVVLLVDNGGQLGAAVAAAAGCAWASRRGAVARRRAWLLLAIGTGCWATGQAVWAYYEIVVGDEAPFPSWADVGFLMFPAVAAAGLVSWMGSGARVAARARDVMDGAIIASSLVVLSWGTTLGSVYAAGADDRLAFVLSLAYPVGDVLMAALVLITLSRSKPSERGVLIVLAAGLGGLAVADSAYVYLVTEGSYASGNLISAGWVVGFLLIAAGALSSATAAGSDDTDAHVFGDVGQTLAASRLPMLLPYVPLVAAEGVVIAQLTRLAHVPVLSVVLGFALVALVLARQLLALSENRHLLVELGSARDRLHLLALHDGLTGLANRTLFLDRVQHALTVHGPEHGVAVLFCDLDDFKVVNDGLGHDAGDTLLCLVARRLQSSLGPGDTVARLGGDEFAVLLEDPDEACAIAARLVEDVGRPCVLDGATVQVSVSVGVALSHDLTGDDDSHLAPAEQVRWLLRAADQAMYAAKGAGKGRAVVAGQPTSDDGAMSVPAPRRAETHAGASSP